MLVAKKWLGGESGTKVPGLHVNENAKDFVEFNAHHRKPSDALALSGKEFQWPPSLLKAASMGHGETQRFLCGRGPQTFAPGCTYCPLQSKATHSAKWDHPENNSVIKSNSYHSVLPAIQWHQYMQPLMDRVVSKGCGDVAAGGKAASPRLDGEVGSCLWRMAEVQPLRALPQPHVQVRGTCEISRVRAFPQQWTHCTTACASCSAFCIVYIWELELGNGCAFLTSSTKSRSCFKMPQSSSLVPLFMVVTEHCNVMVLIRKGKKKIPAIISNRCSW